MRRERSSPAELGHSRRWASGEGGRRHSHHLLQLPHLPSPKARCYTPTERKREREIEKVSKGRGTERGRTERGKDEREMKMKSGRNGGKDKKKKRKQNTGGERSKGTMWGGGEVAGG